jgi:hypothetical protein
VSVPISVTATPVLISDGPNNYANNLACEWVLSGGPMTITFTEMATEASYDKVKVFSGGVLLDEYSGTRYGSFNLDVPLSSATLRFESDSSVVAAGFSASISAVAQPIFTPAPVDQATTACSGSVSRMVTSSPVTISDGPSSYGANQNCVWRLTASGSSMTISWSEFATEQGYDYLTVYSGDNTQLLRHSGTTLPSALMVPSSSARIVFAADSSVQSAGFTATVTSIGVGSPVVSLPTAITPVPNLAPTAPVPSVAELPRGSCNGTVNISVSSSVTISDGPSAYANNQTCMWSLTSATGATLRITFSEFATESNYDFVRVYSVGRTAGDTSLLRTLTGNEVTPFSVNVGSSTALVRFSSDTSINAAGFVATASA